MSGFLLDTKVLSEFSRKGEPDRAVKGWLALNAPESRYVSVLTLAEIRRGIELLPAGKRRDKLSWQLESELLSKALVQKECSGSGLKPFN